MAYADLREPQIVRTLLANRNCDIFCLHRDKWSWKVIKALRTFFTQLIRRRSALGGAFNRKSRIYFQDRANILWPIEP